MPTAPSLDLVVATVDRTDDLAALLDSLSDQTHRRFRVVIVDQNEDDRVSRLLAAHRSLETLHLRSERGLSRARNRALPVLAGDLVAFPDDDCRYPRDLLERVAGRFAREPTLGGLSGRPVAPDGATVGRWPATGRSIGPDTVWHSAISHTIFLRREVVERVGRFDEALGLGSGTPWSSGEEIDYLVRALRLGVRLEYDPSLVVMHPVRPVTADGLVALGRRDGGSVGYILAKHRYPGRTVARMLVRPAAAAVLLTVLLEPTRARFHAATVAGRARGYVGARRSKSSA